MAKSKAEIMNELQSIARRYHHKDMSWRMYKIHFLGLLTQANGEEIWDEICTRMLLPIN